MPDFICIPAQLIQTSPNVKIETVTDIIGRHWICTEAPITSNNNKEVSSSPHALAGIELNRLNKLLEYLHLSPLQIFSEWPPEVKQLYDHSIRLEAASLEELVNTLKNKHIPSPTDRINLVNLHFPLLAGSSISNKERQRLIKRSKSICEKHKQKGGEKYISGTLRHNHYNYAKDIIRAAEFSSCLLGSIPEELFCPENINKTLTEGEHEYLENHEDIEGFAIGTMRLIKKEILG